VDSHGVADVEVGAAFLELLSVDRVENLAFVHGKSDELGVGKRAGCLA
jgi:hypothetical protein